MKYISLLTLVSIAMLMYTVYSNNVKTEDNNSTNKSDEDSEEDDDDDDDNNSVKPEGSNNGADKPSDNVSKLMNSEFFQFLDTLDDEDLAEDAETFIGKATNDTYCYIRDDNPYHYFSTKTRYPEYNDSSSLNPPPGCEIVYVWLIMRHGTRYGSVFKTYDYYKLDEVRDKIIGHASKKQTELCTDDLFNLLLWSPVDTGNRIIEPETLTENGYQLIKKFGKLLKEKFPHLIPKEYDEKQIKIHYSNEKKVNQSVQAMTEELFGKAFLPNLLEDNIFYKMYQPNCKKPDVRDRATGYNYTYLAETSDYTLSMVHDVSQRLGYTEDLTYKEVSKLYNGCQYEVAWGSSKSPWCAAFKKEDLKIMEYIGDISYYYYCGPGNIYNMFQGCILLKEMITNLKNAADDTTSETMEKLTMYIGHSTTLLFLISQLGLVQDGQILTHRNYHQLRNRKWRTSFLAPYAGNIIAILHKCSSGEKYRVKFLLNEKPFKFDGICDEYDLCPVENIYNLFEPIITSEECSTRFCSHTPDEMCHYLQFNENDCLILKEHYRIMKKKEEEKKLMNDESNKEEKSNEEGEIKYDDEEQLFLQSLYKYNCVFLFVLSLIPLFIFLRLCKTQWRLSKKKETVKKEESSETHKTTNGLEKRGDLKNKGKAKKEKASKEKQKQPKDNNKKNK